MHNTTAYKRAADPLIRAYIRVKAPTGLLALPALPSACVHAGAFHCVTPVWGLKKYGLPSAAGTKGRRHICVGRRQRSLLVSARHDACRLPACLPQPNTTALPGNASTRAWPHLCNVLARGSRTGPAGRPAPTGAEHHPRVGCTAATKPHSLSAAGWQLAGRQAFCAQRRPVFEHPPGAQSQRPSSWPRHSRRQAAAHTLALAAAAAAGHSHTLLPQAAAAAAGRSRRHSRRHSLQQREHCQAPRWRLHGSGREEG